MPLVFTGGIRENSVALRSDVCEGVDRLGVRLDRRHDSDLKADCDVASPDSPARVLLIHTREDFTIAREARWMAET